VVFTKSKLEKKTTHLTTKRADAEHEQSEIEGIEQRLEELNRSIDIFKSSMLFFFFLLLVLIYMFLRLGRH